MNDEAEIHVLNRTRSPEWQQPDAPARRDGQPDEPVPGLVWAFRIHENGSAEPLAADKPIPMQHDGWLWLHMNLADVRAQRWLPTVDFPPAATALLTSHDNHQQLHASDGCIYGVFSDLTQEVGEAGDEFAHLHFAMNERMLISGRYRPLAAAEKVRSIIEQGECKLPSVATLLEMIVENVADTVDRLADRIGASLDRIEDGLRNAKDDVRQELGGLRRTAVKLHRQLSGLRTLFHRLERDGTETLKPALQLRASKLAQRLDALDHAVIEIRDRALLLQEEIAAMTAERSNRALNILTVITTVILPPTLVTGVFGMNTKGLPLTEDPNGFLIAAGLMMASVVALWLVMKRIGALKF
jgi:zinc transporter